MRTLIAALATASALLLSGCAGDDDGAAAGGPEAPDDETGRLVLLSDRDRGLFPPDLYSVTPDGSDVVRLTDGFWPTGDPVAGPGGGSILFSAYDVENGTIADPPGADVYLARVDGSAVHPITSGRGVYNWSASYGDGGRRIVFASDREGQFEIYAMNPDGTDQRRLTRRSDAHDTQPSLSPDGTRIVFVSQLVPGRGDDGVREIFIMDADGGNVRQLTDTGVAEQSPVWSPDARRIAFMADMDPTDDESPFDIFVMDPDGGNVVNLTNRPGAASRPVWVDRERVVFAHDRECCGPEGSPGNLDVYVARADGSSLENLTNHPAEDRGPVVSPDGTRLAFTSYRDAPADRRTADVYTMDLTGGRVSRVTTSPADDAVVAWPAAP